MSKLPPPPTKTPSAGIKRTGPPPPPKIPKKTPIRPTISEQQMPIQQNSQQNQQSIVSEQRTQKQLNSSMLQAQSGITAPVPTTRVPQVTQNNKKQKQIIENESYGNDAVTLKNQQPQISSNIQQLSSQLYQEQQQNRDSQMQMIQSEINQNKNPLTASQNLAVRRPPPPVPNRKQVNVPGRPGAPNPRKNVTMPKPPPMIKPTVQLTEQRNQDKNELSRPEQQNIEQRIQLKNPINNPNIQQKQVIDTNQITNQQVSPLKNSNNTGRNTQKQQIRQQIEKNYTKQEQAIPQTKIPPPKAIPQKQPAPPINNKIMNKVVPRPKFQPKKTLQKPQQRPQTQLEENIPKTQVPKMKKYVSEDSSKQKPQFIQQTPKTKRMQSQIISVTKEQQIAKSKIYHNKSNLQSSVLSLTPKYSNLMVKLKDFSIRREKMLQSSSQQSNSDINSQTYSQMDRNKQRNIDNKESKNTKSVKPIKKQYAEQLPPPQQNADQNQNTKKQLPPTTFQIPHDKIRRQQTYQLQQQYIPAKKPNNKNNPNINLQPQREQNTKQSGNRQINKLSKNKSASLLTQHFNSNPIDQQKLTQTNPSISATKTSFRKQANKIQVIQFQNKNQQQFNQQQIIQQQQEQKQQTPIKEQLNQPTTLLDDHPLLLQNKDALNIKSKLTTPIKQTQEEEYRDNSSLKPAQFHNDSKINLYSPINLQDEKNNKLNTQQNITIPPQQQNKKPHKIAPPIKKTTVLPAAPSIHPSYNVSHHAHQSQSSQSSLIEPPSQKIQQITELLKKFAAKKQQYLRNAQQLSSLCLRNRQELSQKISTVNQLLLKLQGQNVQFQHVIKNY